MDHNPAVREHLAPTVAHLRPQTPQGNHRLQNRPVELQRKLRDRLSQLTRQRLDSSQQLLEHRLGLRVLGHLAIHPTH